MKKILVRESTKKSVFAVYFSLNGIQAVNCFLFIRLDIMSCDSNDQSKEKYLCRLIRKIVFLQTQLHFHYWSVFNSGARESSEEKTHFLGLIFLWFSETSIHQLLGPLETIYRDFCEDHEKCPQIWCFVNNLFSQIYKDKSTHTNFTLSSIFTIIIFLFTKRLMFKCINLNTFLDLKCVFIRAEDPERGGDETEGWRGLLVRLRVVMIDLFAIYLFLKYLII